MAPAYVIPAGAPQAGAVASHPQALSELERVIVILNEPGISLATVPRNPVFALLPSAGRGVGG